jgi:predicted Zn-dependent protease
MVPTATRSLSRRQCCGRLVTLLGGLAAGGCATVSPQEERQLGRNEAQEIERTVGLVRERRVVAYIEAIGARLRQATGRADISWQWSVADDGDANAFALPGGWVYITRGLLALSNREDELAGILAHEMAHVVERHAVSRVGAATPLAILFGVPSGILGMVSPGLGGLVGGAGRVISGLALAPYSREQELEADRVGIALTARAGWDPRALANVLGTLERAEALAGGAPRRSSFFATHPSTPDRVANIEALAGSLPSASVAPIARSRPALLSRLEGLVIGTNAAHGVFAGQLFLHADFDLAAEIPAGWKTANTPEAAGAVAPGEAAVVLLNFVASGDDPVSGARADGLTDAQIQRIRRLQISQLPAAALTASTRDGTRVALTWIAHRKRVFRVTGACVDTEWERYRDDFERTAASFRPLRPQDGARITENRLRIRAAREGESIAQVLARGGATWSPAQAAAANGVAIDRKLERDWPVKVAVSERYHSAGGPTPR